MEFGPRVEPTQSAPETSLWTATRETFNPRVLGALALLLCPGRCLARDTRTDTKLEQLDPPRLVTIVVIGRAKPDRNDGLGYLKTASESFVELVLGFSSKQLVARCA